MITPYLVVALVLYWLYQKDQSKIYKEETKYNKEYLEFENERFANKQKFSQELEDRQHYSNFKLERIGFISNLLSGSDLNTTMLVQEHPEYLDEVTDENLEEYKEKYKEYLSEHKAFMTSDFFKGTQLSEKEHYLKYKYAYKTFRGVDSGILITNPRTYTIYDYSSAEFINNNSLEEKFNKEFNLK